MTNTAHVCGQTKHLPFLPRAENESVCFLTGTRSGGKSPHGPEKERARQGKGCHACLSLRLNRKLKNSSCRYALRPRPPFHFLIAAGVACAELPPDLPPATPLPLAPGPVIGGTIKGNPAAGVVPVRELIEANRRNENIPMAEPIPGETVSSIPQAEPIPNAEPIPGETNLHAPVQPAGPVPVIPPTAFSPVPVPQHETRVAILGYHDFSRTLPATEMRMNTDVFRAQMQALKASGVPVISMKEFLEWKLGSRQLPAKCVMITIDDGWKSVYTDAYPILKETGFPFTVFPYTKFITGRGSAMSHDQIQEMLDNGATLGSHSVSHLYPRSWRAAQRKGTQAVLDLATAEISNSRKILQEKFPGSAVEAYCYPGGFVLPDMITKAEEAGFQAAFTVIPKKVTKDTDRWRVHRYMVLARIPRHSPEP